MSSIYFLETSAQGPAWAPFADATPVHTLRAGAWRLSERWARALGGTPTAVIGTAAPPAPVPDALPTVPPELVVGPAWVVDATFAPKVPMRAVGGAQRLVHNRQPVAWRLDAGETWRGPFTSGDGLVIDGKALQATTDLLTVLEQWLFADTILGLEGGSDPIPDGVIVLGNRDAIAIRGAILEPGVVLDVRKGAIILERGVEVRSGTRIEGPSWVHEDSLLLGGQLRQVSIGPQCRVHGEVANAVFMGYSNKSHDGFVGHSVIGSWVNLGAGTITSNLKNTYGQVHLEVGRERIETGRNNVGALIGDHVKTAIGTLLSTGTVLGAGAQLFLDARAPKYLPPFAWGDAATMAREDAFIIAAQRILPRRAVTVDPDLEAGLRALHRRLTAR